MKTFYERTRSEDAGMKEGTKSLRDNGMFQASKYLEREKLKLNQIIRQRGCIDAYKGEL